VTALPVEQGEGKGFAPKSKKIAAFGQRRKLTSYHQQARRSFGGGRGGEGKGGIIVLTSGKKKRDPQIRPRREVERKKGKGEKKGDRDSFTEISERRSAAPLNGEMGVGKEGGRGDSFIYRGLFSLNWSRRRGTKTPPTGSGGEERSSAGGGPGRKGGENTVADSPERRGRDRGPSPGSRERGTLQNGKGRKRRIHIVIQGKGKKKGKKCPPRFARKDSGALATAI